MSEEKMTQDQVEKIIGALRTCAFEFITLIPRLTPMYAKNAQACVDQARAALSEAGRKL